MNLVYALGLLGRHLFVCVYLSLCEAMHHHITLYYMYSIMANVCFALKPASRGQFTGGFHRVDTRKSVYHIIRLDGVTRELGTPVCHLSYMSTV